MLINHKSYHLLGKNHHLPACSHKTSPYWRTTTNVMLGIDPYCISRARRIPHCIRWESCWLPMCEVTFIQRVESLWGRMSVPIDSVIVVSTEVLGDWEAPFCWKSPIVCKRQAFGISLYSQTRFLLKNHALLYTKASTFGSSECQRFLVLQQHKYRYCHTEFSPSDLLFLTSRMGQGCYSLKHTARLRDEQTR